MLDSPLLADLLRTYRIDARLSQEALAERAGISARTIGDIETGIARFPRAITLSLISEALGLDPPARDALRAAARRRSPAPAKGEVAGTPDGGSPLIGRDAELAAIASLLADDAARLVTLTGGAGAGKTVLALQAARAAAAQFGGNVIVVELGGIPDAALVSTKIALAVGIRNVNAEPVATSIAAALAGRPMLLVLDTFEHVTAAALFVSELLAAIPALKLIVTSRVPLRVARERTLPVGPLAVPPSEAALAPSALGSIAAVELLVDRARRYKPEFSVTEDNAAGIAALVRALDGVPFAIELAAPLLRISSPAALAQRLERPLDVLVAERSDVPPRQRTMRDAIAWSYALLTPEQQRALRRLGIFTGAFGLDAAQRVIANASGNAALATLQALAALADQSLVNVVESAGHDPRFEVPALVRDYAVELLADSGESDAVHQRLADYCSALLGSSAPEKRSGNVVRKRLELESSNFDAVLAWARVTGRISLGLALAVRLRPYWWLRGAHPDGHVWLNSLLELAAGRDNVDDALLANGYEAAAGLAQASGRFDAAADYIRRSLPLKRASGDRKAVASLLSDLASAPGMRATSPAAKSIWKRASRYGASWVTRSESHSRSATWEPTRRP